MRVNAFGDLARLEHLKAGARNCFFAEPTRLDFAHVVAPTLSVRN